MSHGVIGQCPVCSHTLKATGLYCRVCDTETDGHFSLGRFGQLAPEQLHFAETSIRCEGKITLVEDELGISYPTVRNRLNELIQALGFDGEGDTGPSHGERHAILERLPEGEIDADEAVKLLRGRAS